MDEYIYGYPKECRQCVSFSEEGVELKVLPYLQENSKNHRVMLIGQDPTIYRDPDRVKRVLMLDEENGQLRRWLKTLFEETKFDALTLYATNLIKCTFEKPPYRGSLKKTLHYLDSYFNQCKNHIINEIQLFKPQIVLTLGGPTHYLFTTLFDNKDDFSQPMKEAFTGEFRQAEIGNITFDYSPCLHIKTFHVAETYGEPVQKFKAGLSRKINNSQRR